MAQGSELLNYCTILSKELQHADSESTDSNVDYAIRRFGERLRKRARLGQSGLAEKALTDFCEVNQLVRNINLDLDRDIEHIARVFISEAFERYNASHDPDLIQVSYDYRHLLRFWRLGPGASYDVLGTHTAEKLPQAMTVTPGCKPAVVWLRDNNVYMAGHDLLSPGKAFTLVAGSRLTTVPKNETTERTIAIEPSGNMALQLALGEYIADVLRRLGLDIRTQQPKNKLLAKIGSVDGSLATLDLKSASDMFSVELVRKLMPPGVFSAMMHFRSPQTLIKGEWVDLHMMSTMGNGFTFPMMTLIFVALVYANGVKQGTCGRWLDWSKRAVYGDDIIVPTAEARSLITVLTSCGFIVNSDKSYLEGPFRESCGGDFYRGYDVTPVYVKELSCDADVYVAINKVFEWCARHKKLLPKTLTYLFSLLRKEVCFVPEWHGDDAGFRTVEVPPVYTYLKPKTKRVPFKGPFYQMMLVVGGYLEPIPMPSYLDTLAKAKAKSVEMYTKEVERVKTKYGDVCGFYTPRPFKTRYKRKRGRLPTGFLSGRDCHSRSDEVSRYVESYAFLGRLNGI